MRGKYKERAKNLQKNQNNQFPQSPISQPSVDKLISNKISIIQNINSKQNEKIMQKEKSKQSIISSKEIPKTMNKQYSSQNYKSTYMIASNEEYFYSNPKRFESNSNYITNYSTKISNKNNINNFNEINEKFKNKNNLGYNNIQNLNSKYPNLKINTNSFKNINNTKTRIYMLEQNKLNKNNDIYPSISTSENILGNNTKISNSGNESENNKSFNFSRNNPLKSTTKINYSNNNNNCSSNNQNFEMKTFKPVSKRKFYKNSKMNQTQAQTINSNPNTKYYSNSVNKIIAKNDNFNNIKSLNPYYEETNSVENFPKITINKNTNNIQDENNNNYKLYQYPYLNLKNKISNNNNDIQEFKKQKNNLLYRNTSNINPSDNSSPVNNNENRIKFSQRSPNPVTAKQSYVQYFDYTNSMNSNITNNFNINNYNINNYNKNQITKQYFGITNIYSKEDKLNSPNTKKKNEINNIDNKSMKYYSKKIYVNNNEMISNESSNSPRVYKKKLYVGTINDNKIEKNNRNIISKGSFKIKPAKNEKCIYQKNLINTEQRYKNVTNTQRDNVSFDINDDINLLKQNKYFNFQQSLNNTNNTNNDQDNIIYQQKSKTYIRKKHNTYVIQNKNKEYSSNKEDTTTSNNYDDLLSKHHIYQNEYWNNYNINNPMNISEIKNKKYCFVEKYYKYALKNENNRICYFTKINYPHKKILPLNKISYFTKSNIIIKNVNKFREIVTEDNFTFCEDEILSNKKVDNTIEHDFSDIHSLANDSIVKMFSNNTNNNNNPVNNDITLGRIHIENSVVETKKGDNLSDNKLKESSFTICNKEENENEDFKINLSDDDDNNNNSINNKEINNTINDSGYNTPKLFEKNFNENNNNKMINKSLNKLAEKNNTKKYLEIFTGKLENIFNKHNINKNQIKTAKTIYKNTSFNSIINNNNEKKEDNKNDNNIINEKCKINEKFPVKYKAKSKTYIPKKCQKGKYYQILKTNDLTPLDNLEKKMNQLLNIFNKKNNIKKHEVDFILSLQENKFTSSNNLLPVSVLEHIQNMKNFETYYAKKEKNFSKKENKEITNNKNIEDIGKWGRKDMVNEIKQAEKYIEQLHIKMSENEYKYKIINTLNILTLDNFYVILEKLNNYIISEKDNKNKIKEKEIIFVEVSIDKAILETKFSILYAKLCLELSNLINNNDIIYFMNLTIEKRFNNLNNISIYDISNKNEEYFIIKKKFLGTVNLIADLIKLKIKTIIYGFNCINILLNKYYALLKESEFNLRYLNLEAAVNFLSKFGKIIIETNNKNYIEKLNDYINKKLFLIIDDNNVKKDYKIPGYIKYKIINLLEKSKNNWENSLYENSIQIKGKNNNDLLLFYKNANKNTKIGKSRSKSMNNKNIFDLNFSFINIFKDENVLINYSFNIPIKTGNYIEDKKEKIKSGENYLTLIKNDLQNFKNYLMNNNVTQAEKLSSEKIEKIADEYDWEVIDNLINIKKVNLADIINYFLETCIDFIDNDSHLFFSIEYIKNIINYYLPFELEHIGKFRQKILNIFLNVKELVIDNIFMYEIMGFILFLLLNNNAIEMNEFNIFIKKEEEIITMFAKVVKNCIIFSKGEKQNYFVKFRDLELFKNNRSIFYNNVSRPLRALLI